MRTASFSDDESPFKTRTMRWTWQKSDAQLKRQFFPSASIKRGLNSLKWRLCLDDDQNTESGTLCMVLKTRNKHHYSLYIWPKKCVPLVLRRIRLVYTAMHGAHVPGAKIISLFLSIIKFLNHRIYNDKIQQLPNRGCLYYWKPHERRVGAWNKKETRRPTSDSISLSYSTEMWCFNHSADSSCCALRAVNRATNL